MEEAAEFIPDCVTAIAAYWRGKGPKQISMPLAADPQPQPDRAPTKVGRNDPCPCGSGKKFKKCCGKAIKDWSLTSLKDKLIKIGAKVVSHGRYVAFQMAEVAIPRQMFQEILRLIAELRPQPPPAPA